MKANRFYRANGQRCATMNISFTANSDHIIAAIISLVSSGYNVNKTTVEKEIRNRFYSNGAEWSIPIYDGATSEDIDSATERAKELFPNFFKTVTV